MLQHERAAVSVASDGRLSGLKPRLKTIHWWQRRTAAPPKTECNKPHARCFCGIPPFAKCAKDGASGFEGVRFVAREFAQQTSASEMQEKSQRMNSEGT